MLIALLCQPGDSGAGRYPGLVGVGMACPGDRYPGEPVGERGRVGGNDEALGDEFTELFFHGQGHGDAGLPGPCHHQPAEHAA